MSDDIRDLLGEATPPPATPDGARILDDVERFVGRFVAFPSDAARVAVTLWTAHAHVVESFDSTPRLALLSPEPGSGKTRTLEVLELLCPAPLSCLSASSAAVFRSLAVQPRVLLFDEVDTIFTRRGGDDGAEDLRALINAGHRKGATIPRCVGPTHAVAEFPVYGAAALAGLGDLPDTVMSRSLIVRMRRRAPDEHVEPFRRRLHAIEGTDLREALAAWTGHVEGDLAGAWPDMPDGIVDRPADVWEPLLAVADAAGGRWPQRARAACVELCKVAESREASLGVKLLADLREIWGQADALPTETILDQLHKLDESPWNDLHGKPIDARGLARRLRTYGAHSVDVRLSAKSVLKGYRRADLWDAWSRYLPPPGKSATSATSATPQVSGLSEVADVAVGSGCSATAPTSATDETPVGEVADVALPHRHPLPTKPPLTRHVADVADVALPEGETEDTVARIRAQTERLRERARQQGLDLDGAA